MRGLRTTTRSLIVAVVFLFGDDFIKLYAIGAIKAIRNNANLFET